MDAPSATGSDPARSPAAGPDEAPAVVLAAQERERARLAREVHDGPAQALTNAIFQVEYIERLLDRDPDEARAELRGLRTRLHRELAEVRSFIARLRPPLSDDLALEEALHDLVGQMAPVTGISVEVDLAAPATRLSAAERTVALRVAQEALQNVRKHAAASSASVGSRVEGGAWVLEVRDDGRGFDPVTVRTRTNRSFGLQFMRERAQLIGAVLDVRSAPDEGTIVRLAVPVRGEEST